MDLLSTLRSKRGCPLSKQQLPKLKCLEKSPLPTICNKEINPEAGCKRKSEKVLESRDRKKLKMDGTGASKTDMGLVSTFPNTNGVTSMKPTPRINYLAKKPENGTCKLSEVKCVKKVPSTEGGGCKFDTSLGEKKLKSTLRPENVIRACPLLSKQLPKVKCLEKSSVPNNCNKELNPVVGCKRKSEELSESRERKKMKLKMDGATTLICNNILTEIMVLDKQSGPCHTPIKKPRRWGLDACSDFVNKPEDLGTIKQKLEQHKYLFAEQFEADVRRILSTAMLCNPGDKHYHESAKELLRTFDRLWKPVTMRKGWKELLKPTIEPQKIEPALLFYCAEKARLEAKGEAVKSTARLQSEYEVKKQREAARKASRIALDMMEKSVVIDDNWKVFKDLEALTGQPMVRSQMKNNKLIKSPLEELGLYIKEEYTLGNEDDYCISTNEEDYLEEGEIIW